MNITAQGIKCAAETAISNHLLTLADAQGFLFTLLRKELPHDCRDLLDDLQIAARAIDWSKPEDERFNAADALMKSAEKLAQELTNGSY